MNVGLVGCGRIAKKHFAGIEANGLMLFGVYDIVKDKMPPNTGHYACFEDMVGDPHVDIISICTPSYLHAEMAIKAANAGKHVLLEKPIALKIKDAEDVIKTCAVNNMKLCVVVQNRFNAKIMMLKWMFDDNTLGTVLLANTTCRWNRPQSYFEGWQSSWDRSGGVIINQLIHPLDMLLYLVGPVASVSAYADNLCRSLPFPDTYVANLKFWNGAIGSFEGTICAHPQNAENSITVVCEKGIMKIGGVALDRLDYILTDEIQEGGSYRLDKADIYGLGHERQYREMVMAIKEDRKPMTDGYAALKALKLAYAIHDSARENKEIYLE